MINFLEKSGIPDYLLLINHADGTGRATGSSNRRKDDPVGP